MKKFLISVFALYVAVLLGGCAQKPDPEKIKANAKDLDDRYVAAINKEDIGGIMELHWNSPEVIFYTPLSMEERGYQAIEAFYEKIFAENEFKSVQFTNSSYMALGDYGLSQGNFSVTIADQDGKEMKLEGRFTYVSGMKDGKWVYIVRHGSVPLPPPPTMEQMQMMMKEMMKKK